MNKLQKLNVLRTSRKDFQTRLTELRKRKTDRFTTEEDLELLKLREEDLRQGIKFCNYLTIALRHNNDFGPENENMLKFIGLEEFCKKSL